MHTHEPALVLGMDIGGTSSRALVADLSGRTLGTGAAGGGNPNSHPPEQAVAEIAAAARAAMTGIEPSSVRAGVLGMAGVSKLADPSVTELFEQTWSALGLTCPMRTVGDCEVAFASGTDAASGTVLIAGTGSIAARIDRHRQVATSGGYGWLLGDEGSAFWLGREAARETLHALEQGTPGDELAGSVVETLLGAATDPETARKRLIATVNAAPPIRLAELAPLVTSAANAGDKAAIDIVRRAATLLVDTAQATRPPGDTAPIVLAGSLVAEDNPLGAALHTEITARGYGQPLFAGPGAAGAAWLATLELIEEDEAAALHAHLVPRP